MAGVDGAGAGNAISDTLAPGVKKALAIDPGLGDHVVHNDFDHGNGTMGALGADGRTKSVQVTAGPEEDRDYILASVRQRK